MFPYLCRREIGGGKGIQTPQMPPKEGLDQISHSLRMENLVLPEQGDDMFVARIVKVNNKKKNDQECRNSKDDDDPVSFHLGLSLKSTVCGRRSG